MNGRNLAIGSLGGLFGGAIFGAMMAQMGMLPMIGKMVGHANAVTGFVVHLVISAAIGASFAVLFGKRVKSNASGLGLGAAYGAVWWLLGPLTLMPLFMGMGFGVNWTAAAAAKMFPSLIGHVIFGLALGYGVAFLKARIANCESCQTAVSRG